MHIGMPAVFHGERLSPRRQLATAAAISLLAGGAIFEAERELGAEPVIQHVVYGPTREQAEAGTFNSNKKNIYGLEIVADAFIAAAIGGACLSRWDKKNAQQAAAAAAKQPLFRYDGTAKTYRAK
jgi:hypothetical protein